MKKINYKGYTITTNGGHCALVYLGGQFISAFAGTDATEAITKAKNFVDISN